MKTPVRTPSDLSPRQQQVLRLIAEEETTKGIAQLWHRSAKTVEFHRLKLMNRTGIHSIAGLVRLAIRLGLVTDPAPADPWPNIRPVQRHD